MLVVNVLDNSTEAIISYRVIGPVFCHRALSSILEREKDGNQTDFRIKIFGLGRVAKLYKTATAIPPPSTMELINMSNTIDIQRVDATQTLCYNQSNIPFIALHAYTKIK